MKSILSIPAFLLVCIFLTGKPLHACSCIRHSPAEAYEWFPSIFEGTVTSVSLDTSDVYDDFIYYRVIIEISVSNVWKGDIAEQVIIETSMDGAACGYYFKLDTEYLVYGSAGDTISVNSCSRTNSLDRAQEDLAYLNFITSFGHSENTKRFQLLQNFPNPFNSSTKILYLVRGYIDTPVRVSISIYNILGRKVVTLVNEEQLSGFYTVTLDASDLAGGIYICTMHAGNRFRESRKLVVLK